MKLLISAAILAAALPASVQAQTFDFETAATTTTSSYSATQSGLTLSLTRQGGKVFGFSDIGGSAPGFGTRSLAPFVDSTTGAFVANFSSGLSFFSFQAGDFAPSDADVITLNIFSGLGGTGTLLGSTSFNYGVAGLPAFATLSLTSATPFLSAVFNGGSPEFPNSVFYDNIVVRQANSAVPEPATWMMMIGGFGLMGATFRRKLASRVTYA